MRYEDWTLRKTEVRLAEHGELRSALGLRKAPDHTTLYRFLRRLDERALVAALNETVRGLPKPSLHEQEPAAIVAVDATGLAPGAISTFYVRRTHNRGGEPMRSGVDGLSGSSWSTLIIRWCWRKRPALVPTMARRCCDHL